MTRYEKNGVLHALGTPMQHPDKDGVTINPNADWLIANGWAEVIPEVIEPTPTPEPTAAELRKVAYATEQIIGWEGEMVTVDYANTLFNAYLAEGNTEVATTLSGLIAVAKAEIRAQYVDQTQLKDEDS